jgi:hypothetical protein
MEASDPPPSLISLIIVEYNGQTVWVLGQYYRQLTTCFKFQAKKYKEEII